MSRLLRARPDLGWPRLLGSSRLVPALAIPIFATACLWAAWVPLRVGPNEWDDAAYCELAATGWVAHDIRNRYIHVWGLRLFFEVFDNRRVAAINYTASVVIAMGVAAFFLGRRMGGNLCGLLSMAFIALSAPMLRYISVPHVDLPMAMWSAVAVAATVAACEAKSRRWSFTAAAAAGLTAYFAAKTKETGLAVVPVVLYLIIQRSDERARRLAALGSGVVLAWLIHLGLDARFASDGAGFWPSDWSAYVADAPPRKRPRAPKHRMKLEYFEMLTAPEYWAFTFAGLAGAATGFHQKLAVRATAMWLLAALLFTGMICWRYPGLDANHRYGIVLCAALAILAAFWSASILRRPPGHELDSLWLVPILLLLGALCVRALWAKAFGGFALFDKRALFFLLPILFLLLFLTPFLSRGRYLPAAAVGLLIGLSVVEGYNKAHDYAEQRRKVLSAWIELAEELDRRGLGLAGLNPGRWENKTATRRLRALSSRPYREVSMRHVSSPEQVRADEWLLVPRERDRNLEKQGWRRRIVSSERHDWSVYERLRKASSG